MLAPRNALRQQLERLHMKHINQLVRPGAGDAPFAASFQRPIHLDTRGSQHSAKHLRLVRKRLVAYLLVAAPCGAASPFSAGEATTSSSPPVVWRVVPGTGCDSLTCRPSPLTRLPPLCAAS